MTRTDELLWRIGAMCAYPIYAVNVGTVDVDELLKSRPGGLVRIKDNAPDCVMVIESHDAPYDAVAGWISEDA